MGALGIVRISGERAIKILEEMTGKSFEHRKATPFFFENFGKGVVVCWYRPNSYTGEDLVEITLPGNYYLINNFIKEIQKRGAIPSLPGEFTFRAFLNGKIDLTQAEAINSLYLALSPQAQRKLSLMAEGFFSNKILELREKLLEVITLTEAQIEFEEEDLEISLSQIEEEMSEIIKLTENLLKKSSLQRMEDFFNVIIAGPPNSGKSTLFNKILGYERVLVSEEKGTTRDMISETLFFDGYPVKLWDSAGVFKAKGKINKRAIEITKRAILKANFILYLHEGSIPFKGVEEDLKDLVKEKGEIVFTKKDLGIDRENEKFPYLKISALKDEGIDDLMGIIKLKAEDFYKRDEEGDFLLNERQKEILNSFLENLKEAQRILSERKPLEIFAFHLKTCSEEIMELTGEIKTEEVLNSIFSKFCIGK